MTNPRLLRKMAKRILDTIREYENKGEKHFDKFVVGKSTLAVVQQNPVTGRPEQSTWAVMETIYDDYREHPELKINEKLQEVLNDELLNENYHTYLKNAIECLLYQLRSEKQNTAPFKLDCVKLLENLRQNIQNNRKKFELYNMISELEDYNTVLNENYNQKIM